MPKPKWEAKKTYRAIILIQDGVGDRPVPELGGRTPLEVARKPHMDTIALLGATGLMDLIEPGVRPGTDTGHLALFGYDPYKYYPGRGPLEAAGIGVPLRPGDVALRCNIATVEERNGELIVVDRRAGRIRGDHVKILVEALNKAIKEVDGVKIEFYPATEHRVVMVLRGEGLSPKISDSDPGTAMEGHPIRKVKPLDDSEEARRTAEIVNKAIRLAHQVLRDHPLNKERVEKGLLPGNAIITRGAGMVPRDLKPFHEVFKTTAYVVAEEATIVGIARILGMGAEIPPGATATLDTDLDSILESALKAWRQGYEIIYIHVKGPDIAGHDADPYGKIKIIERTDQMLGKLMKQIDWRNTVIALAADHSTPCTVRDHSGDPVPIAIYAPTIRRDHTRKYDEYTCSQGILGRIRGTDLIKIILDQMNKPLKWGA